MRKVPGGQRKGGAAWGDIAGQTVRRDEAAGELGHQNGKQGFTRADRRAQQKICCQSTAEVCLRPRDRTDRLRAAFAHRDTRKTDHGGGIFYNGKRCAPASVPNDCDFAGKNVEAGESFSGRLYCAAGGRFIEMEECPKPERSTASKTMKKSASSPGKAHKPAPNHPWRRYSVTKSKIDACVSGNAAS